jgi:hypothetical protein
VQIICSASLLIKKACSISTTNDLGGASEIKVVFVIDILWF